LFRKLTEEDFAVLRKPLESGRQNPSSFAAILILSIFLQALMFFLTYIVAADSSLYPNMEIIFVTHLIVTSILILLSIIYSIPAIYMKFQRLQYLVTIMVSQNLFGVFFYIAALFIIGSNRLGLNVSRESLLFFTFVTLLFGLLIFIATSIRFYILLRNGRYQKGSKKDEIRGGFETKSYLPIAIIGGVGLVFVIQYIARNSYMFDINVIIVILIGPLLFYAMLFVLPEQIVILYCKYRFDSFNFNNKGELNPMGRKGA